MKHTLINADVLEGLQNLPDESVHCVVTSPPYWGLRDYGVDCQIGLEPTVEEYITKMLDVFREVYRVLRPDGTLWLNIGDKYSTSNPIGRGDAGKIWKYKDSANLLRKGSFRHDKADVVPKRYFSYGIPEKNLIGLPWRIAFALQADGWILRSEIIWSKPNAMPESVTDRPAKSHEQVFLFTKSSKYFYDSEAVREEQIRNSHTRGRGKNPKSVSQGKNIRANSSFQDAISKSIDLPNGRNLRTVWTIPTQPRLDAHFATFPDELARRCILAGTSEYGCCPVCGAPWKRIVKAEGETIGWKPSCSCEKNIPVPCTVLDPFGGSGTVANIARQHNRSSILIEINPDYIDLQKHRLRTNEQLDTGICSIEVITREHGIVVIH